MDHSFLDDLSLDSSRISTSQSALAGHSTDWGTREEDGVPPDVVVWPISTAEVSAVLAAANEHGVPVTPYAAGTSLEGNPVPVEGGISLDLTRMNEVVDVRPEDLQIDVQPGVLGSEVDDAVAAHGLFFPPLPSSGKISTIGGMLANDASGMGTVKYGEVRDWTLALEVVLADGTVLRTGSRAAKTSSGYNLTELFVGSEGTLGVITEATLELAGRPEQIWGGRATFETVGDASAAIADAVQSGVDLAKSELLDARSVEMVNAHLGTDLPVRPTAFLEFHANHGIEREVEFCRAIFESHGADRFEVEESGPEMDALWEAREEIAHALDPYREDLSLLAPGDVTVPIGEYAALIEFIADLADERDLLIPCFGHAGDGNVHYNVMVDRDDPDSVERGKRASDEIVAHAIDLGGTATGEHGIGLGKQAYLRDEHGASGVETMRTIKRALDPNGILNPGKVLPAEEL